MSRPSAGEKFGPESLADADVPGERSHPAGKLDECAVGFGMSAHGLNERRDHFPADRVGTFIIVAVLRRRQELRTQRGEPLEVGVERIAQFRHCREVLLKDYRLEGRQRVDGMCGALCEHAERAELRSARRHVTAR